MSEQSKTLTLAEVDDLARRALAPAGGYNERIETMLNALAAEPGVRLPGERRHECRVRAADSGIEVPLQLIDKIEAFATSS